MKTVEQIAKNDQNHVPSIECWKCQCFFLDIFISSYRALSNHVETTPLEKSLGIFIFLGQKFDLRSMKDGLFEIF